MKITKAEGYKKPNYAVAVAAAMAMVTVTGCGAGSGPDLAGATTVYTPPEEEIQLAGDVSVAAPNNNVIDYDGGLVMYTEPDDVVELAGDVPEYLVDDNEDEDDVTDTDESEDQDASAYYEPDLVLEGGAPIEEP